MRLTFLSGTPATVRLGSGTYVGIAVLRAELERQGHEIDTVTPSFDRVPLGMTARRLRFNAELPRLLGGRASDVTVGFDMDGFLLHPWRIGPYLASIKGVLAEELLFEQGAVRWLLQLQAWCEARHVGRSPLVVATSRYAAERISIRYAAPRERLRLVPEPIDLRRWERDREDVPRDTGSSPVVLAVAHLYPRKSIDVLIRAMALMPSRWRDVTLHVVGTGPEELRLRHLATAAGLQQRVRFLGHVSRAELVAEYRRCTLFCLPSRQEGFGIVYLEAMAAGKPIVACRASAVPEIVDDRSGLLVQPGDAPALAGAICRLLDDPALRDRLGAGGHAAVRRYDAPLVARQFLAIAEEARDRWRPS